MSAAIVSFLNFVNDGLGSITVGPELIFGSVIIHILYRYVVIIIIIVKHHRYIQNIKSNRDIRIRVFSLDRILVAIGSYPNTRVAFLKITPGVSENSMHDPGIQPHPC